MNISFFFEGQFEWAQSWRETGSYRLPIKLWPITKLHVPCLCYSLTSTSLLIKQH